MATSSELTKKNVIFDRPISWHGMNIGSLQGISCLELTQEQAPWALLRGYLEHLMCWQQIFLALIWCILSKHIGKYTFSTGALINLLEESKPRISVSSHWIGMRKILLPWASKSTIYLTALNLRRNAPELLTVLTLALSSISRKELLHMIGQSQASP